MPIAFFSTLAFLALGGLVHRRAGLPVAAVSGIFALIAAGLWMLSVRLHNRLMRTRAAEDSDPASTSARRASTQARLNSVTQLTNFAFGMALAAVIPLLQAWEP